MAYHLEGETLDRLQRPSLRGPQLAVILYGDAHHAVMLKHVVHDTDTGYELGPGQHLTPQDHAAIVRACGQSGWQFTHPNTLATSISTCAWWVPPGPQALTFDAKYAQTASIARLSGTPIPLPGLVLIATPGQLRVYAVTGAKRPTPDTPLMNAPLWNMFSSHVMCQGTVRYPATCTPDDQAAWERALLMSTFTGPSRSDAYMNWSASYEELLQCAVTEGAFPERALKPAGVTLAQAITGR